MELGHYRWNPTFAPDRSYKLTDADDTNTETDRRDGSVFGFPFFYTSVMRPAADIQHFFEDSMSLPGVWN
jgi:hypothetical protein